MIKHNFSGLDPSKRDKYFVQHNLLSDEGRCRRSHEYIQFVGAGCIRSSWQTSLTNR